MNYFFNINKNTLIFYLVVLTVVPVFGFKFLLGLIGNFLLILLLIPILLLLLIFVGFNSYKSRIKTCDECGVITLNINEQCMNCGAELGNISKKNELDKKPSESTIEVKAEEIK